MANVAINGFGRIGRLFFRQAFENKDINIVAINDLGELENLAYLLKYDTVYGKFDKDVDVKGGKLVVDGKKIEVTQIKDPKELPWKKLKVDIAVEATGVFTKFELAKAHIDAGAKRVVITAPAKDPDGTEGKTVLVGVNDKELESVVLSSNASCTTNAASPVIEVLREGIGIEKAGPSKKPSDPRRGRAAAQNIIPSTTGAALAVSRAIKELEGKFDGVAFRVPVIAGSIADITLVASRDTTVEEVNDVLKKAAKSPRWKGILSVTEDPIVSSDIVGESYGAIADLNYTRVVDGNLVKVLSWYDNEWGYVSTLVRHVVNVTALV
jgi:glyceraldehyde 3-phosphate dehydrogenase